MAMRKISVTVDADVLKAVLETEGEGANVSAIVNDALARLVRRRHLKAWLNEMDRKFPLSAEDKAAGEELWRLTKATRPPRRRR